MGGLTLESERNSLETSWGIPYSPSRDTKHMSLVYLHILALYTLLKRTWDNFGIKLPSVAVFSAQVRRCQPTSRFKTTDSTKQTARRKIVPTNMSMTSRMLFPIRVVKIKPRENMMIHSNNDVCQMGRLYPYCPRNSSTQLTIVSVHA